MRKIITLTSGGGLVVCWLIFSAYSLAQSPTPAAAWLMACFVLAGVFGVAISPNLIKKTKGQ